MKYRVIVVPRAKRQLLDQALWWSEHRSSEQAIRWLDGFELAMASLSDQPERCGIARESVAFDVVLRELLFGVRGKPTHRAVFEIRGDEVIVHCVRHLAQSELEPKDLA